MEVVIEELERAAEVALPAVGVAGEQEFESAGLRLREHLVHRRRAPDGSAAVSNLEDEPRVDEAVPHDEAVLLLALAGGAIAIVLAGCGLTNPACHAETGNIVEGARQVVHAAGDCSRSDIRVMVDRPSSPSRRSCATPFG